MEIFLSQLYSRSKCTNPAKGKCFFADLFRPDRARGRPITKRVKPKNTGSVSPSPRRRSLRSRWGENSLKHSRIEPWNPKAPKDLGRTKIDSQCFPIFVPPNLWELLVPFGPGFPHGNGEKPGYKEDLFTAYPQEVGKNNKTLIINDLR